ncbi:MAG: hypothetical protein K8S55_05170, partial [Phycisphaerae bacterium]|nr:hypothetical protein [Phycisphaerae bacterium]
EDLAWYDELGQEFSDPALTDTWYNDDPFPDLPFSQLSQDRARMNAIDFDKQEYLRWRLEEAKAEGRRTEEYMDSWWYKFQEGTVTRFADMVTFGESSSLSTREKIKITKNFTEDLTARWKPRVDAGIYGMGEGIVAAANELRYAIEHPKETYDGIMSLTPEKIGDMVQNERNKIVTLYENSSSDDLEFARQTGQYAGRAQVYVATAKAIPKGLDVVKKAGKAAKIIPGVKTVVAKGGNAAKKIGQYGKKLVKNKVTKGVTKRTVIGKVKNLRNLGSRENSLLKHMQKNLGNPQANWKQNSGVLRIEMAKGQPIRDASVRFFSGKPINNTGFLRAERNLLQNHGWNYKAKARMWYPSKTGG